LETAATDEDVRQFLPRDAMHLLRSYRQWFLSDGIDEESDIPDSSEESNVDSASFDQDER
jgi:hypothetical protein